MINITGLDKSMVLKVLYDNSKPLGMGILQFVSGGMSLDEAEKLVSEYKYFDYLNGRIMKVDISGDEFDEWGYDRDNGDGSAAKAIDSVR